MPRGSMMKSRFLSMGLGALLAAATFAQPVGATTLDIEPFIRKQEFRDLKLSPDGRHLAATIVLEDRTGLVVLRLADMSVVTNYSLGRNTDISGFQWANNDTSGFQWANNDRILLGVADKFGMLAQPQLTGEIVALNVTGRGSEMLIGTRVQASSQATRIKPRQPESVWALLTDELRGDDKNVIVTVAPFGQDAYTRAERMDVRTGRRVTLATVPVRRARFVSDHEGNVRFAAGAGGDNVSKLYYRDAGVSDWTLINDEGHTRRRESPLGFSGDGRIAYLLSTQHEGTDSILAYDVASGERREILRDDTVDPHEIIYTTAGIREPIGVLFMDGTPRKVFFNNDHAEARLHRMLDQAFEGELVRITSRSSDGRMALALVSSDRNSGDFFLLDTQTMAAERVASRREWLDPLKMAPARPVAMKARDGLDLHGYLTVPLSSEGRNLPLILLPHGGPYGLQDKWEFDEESQLLAAAGYAVLRVNFRGSSGYGRKFREAGAQQWGLAMQDDLTDATRWAISQGIADPSRICIYGASYGAYAALMGAAKEPDLYRCAAGYVGVYDLVMDRAELVSGARSLRTFSDEWIGSDRDALASVSPNRLADRIKVPVLLAAGGEDKNTPIEQTRAMENALKRTGTPVEALYYPNEGHGFYVPKNRSEYYGKLLDFLSRHLGGSKAN